MAQPPRKPSMLTEVSNIRKIFLRFFMSFPLLMDILANYRPRRRRSQWCRRAGYGSTRAAVMQQVTVVSVGLAVLLVVLAVGCLRLFAGIAVRVADTVVRAGHID